MPEFHLATGADTRQEVKWNLGVDTRQEVKPKFHPALGYIKPSN